MARERERLRIGKSVDFIVGTIKVLEVSGREIGVARLRNGELRGIMNRCPHKGAPICQGFISGVWDARGPGELAFDERLDVLVCPWHGFQYDLGTGTEVCWKRASRLRMYTIEETDGEVFAFV
jgi:nitrite reductase/ring-hydroxylating ferredoxin subunit